MRIAISLLLLATSPCVFAAPPTTTPAPSRAPDAAPATHSPIGDVMGSLTRALRDAAQMQAHAGQSADSTHAHAQADSSAPNDPAPPLPPDATAQAAVP